MTQAVAAWEPTAPVEDEAEAHGKTGRTLYIAGRAVQFKVVPQCRVCQAADRELIEHGLILGHGYQAIVKSLPDTSELWYSRDGKERFDLQKVSRLIGQHSRLGHAHADALITRAVQDEWAKRAGLDLDTTTTTIVTEMGMLTEVMRRAWQNLVESDKLPSINQGMRAAELLLTYQAVTGGDEPAVFRDAISAVFRALRSCLSEGQVQEVFALLEKDPAITNAFAALQAGAE